MTPWSFHRILMGSSGSRCTIRYLTAGEKKREKWQKRERETGDWQQFFFDWLFILHPSCQICIYLTRRKKKQDRPQNLASRRLAGKCFGWRSERNRCGESISYSFGYFWTCLFRRKKKNEQNAFYCYSGFNILSTANIYTNEHFQQKKKKKWTFILKTKSERTSNNEFCLAGNSCPCPAPRSPFPPYPSCTPLICGFL